MHTSQSSNSSTTLDQARAILEASLVSTVSDKTVADYVRQFSRMLERSRNFDNDIWKVAEQTRYTSTWFKRRACILYCLRCKVLDLLTEQELLQQELQRRPVEDPMWDRLRLTVKQLRVTCKIYSAAPVNCPLVDPQKRKSKRALGSLPIDWREQLADRLPRWRCPFLVAAVTGCRPSELVKGVVLVVDGHVLEAFIQGSKVKLVSGQEWRRLSWDLNSCASMLVLELASLTREEGGEILVNLGARNRNPARAFSDAIKAASKRAWPGRKRTITAYSLRHAAASHLKSSGLSSPEVSAALGHSAIATKSSYGRTGRGLGVSTAPDKVEAAREVRGEPTVRPKPGSAPRERDS